MTTRRFYFLRLIKKINNFTKILWGKLQFMKIEIITLELSLKQKYKLFKINWL